MRTTATASWVFPTTALINLYYNCLFTFLTPVLDYYIFESRNYILLISIDISSIAVWGEETGSGERREFEIELSIGYDSGLSSGESDIGICNSGEI